MKKIFIAVDTSNVNEAKKIISQTQTNKLDIGYKFGLEFFYSKDGRKFISKLKKKKIFSLPILMILNITMPER